MGIEPRTATENTQLTDFIERQNGEKGQAGGCTRKNMVRMHNPKSYGPRYQTGKLGSHRNSAPITRQREIVRMPQRMSLFPGWDLKISQNT